jgi:hypothetical protein
MKQTHLLTIADGDYEHQADGGDMFILSKIMFCSLNNIQTTK